MKNPSYPHWVITVCVSLPATLPLSPTLWADNRGPLGNGQSFDDSATICLAVGIIAELSGLDNITLHNTTPGVHAGALYQGQDSFQLEANGSVRVIVEGGQLTNGGNTISPQYLLDNQSQLQTQAGESHSGQHQLLASFQLGSISAQRAGDYQGQITLIVTPDMGGLAGCGESDYSYPEASTWGTLAWEDLYPNAGDADYNDMVVNFRIEESYNAQQQLETISMDFVPAARGAGYNHSLHLALDGELDNSHNVDTLTTPVYTGGAEVAVTYTNLNNQQEHTRYFRPGQDLTIFSNTQVAMGGKFVNVYPNQQEQTPAWQTHVEISLNADNYENGNSTAGLASGDFNYRPYLHVNNTNSDIDLVNLNTSDGMIDNNGYPFGLLTPAQWQWPDERMSIDDAYPEFENYRQLITGEVEAPANNMTEQWYNYPSAGW